MNRLRLVTLMYHDVVEGPEISGFQGPGARAYRLGLAEFLAQLDAIEKGPLKPRTVFDLAKVAERRGLLMTFDDGGKSALRAADLLDARNWKGHFFVTTSLIDTPGFVTRGNILDLHRRGHVIGSHSHTHPNICYNLTDDAMYAEWRTSCLELAGILGMPVTVASVPGGDMDRRTAAMAAKAGIEYLFTSEPVLAPWQVAGVTCFGRVCVMNHEPLGEFERSIRCRGYVMRRAIRLGKQLVKKLIGPLYRSRMAANYAPPK
jgi:peptidoglycan/xylan/chitin deacetylase (PgdA/CDA1 family)